MVYILGGWQMGFAEVVGDGQLGGFLGLLHPDFDGMPTSRHDHQPGGGTVS